MSEDDQSGEDEELLHAELSDGSKTNKIKGKKKRSKASVLTVRYGGSREDGILCYYVPVELATIGVQ